MVVVVVVVVVVALTVRGNSLVCKAWLASCSLQIQYLNLKRTGGMKRTHGE